MRGRAPSGQRGGEARDADEALARTGQPGPVNAADAPAAAANGGRGQSEEMPRVRLTRRQLVGSLVFIVSTVAFLYFVLPKLLGLKDTWSRIQHGNPWWLAASAFLECLSFLGYVILFRGVFVGRESRIDLRASYEITMAGLAATRLFASAGAGGIALTAWALRRAGMEPRVVACRMIAFTALLYGVFMATLVIGGIGVYIGLFPGENPFAITMVPAIFGAVVIAIFLGVSLLPGDFDRLVTRWTHGGRLGRIAGHVAAAPASAATGVRTALDLVRGRNPALLGAVAWWGFDIAVLWSCFHAFGGSPPTAVVVMSYFVGMIGNVLPLPGGIGGVDGAMIGSFTAFGISAPLAVVAVLAYRAFAFWLPTVPGAIAYLQLRRTVHRWQSEPSASYT